jgi:hypothetical protein
MVIEIIRGSLDKLISIRSLKLVNIQLFPKSMGTANVKLLFTCPHGGNKPLDIIK